MTAPAPSSYKSGDLIAGKYQLEALLGRGGMGAVWRAQNVALDAAVAIKILSATGDRAALRERLLLEAKTAASVTHPAIVKVFDVGETASGDPFIVMELLNGTSLGSILQTEGRLSAVRALQTLLPIAEALQLAHSRGLVHRDVKPDNIFIVHDESSLQPKLVDFGIVKIQQGEGDTHLTRDGDVLGSPDYLSPEQAQGQSDVDHLSDVWAFSVVLFEAISGRVPFDAQNYNALVRQIIDDEPPSLQQIAVVNRELSAIVARGLSKDRSQRYRSMAELGRALAHWLREQGELHDLCGTSLEHRWLQTADSDELTWQAEPGSEIRAYARETAAAPTRRGARAAFAAAPFGARLAALALIPATLGFGLVAWYNGAFRERPRAVNAAPSQHAVARAVVEASTPEVPAISQVPSATPPEPVAPSLERFATSGTNAAALQGPKRPRRSPAAARPHESAAPAQSPAKPSSNSDLIKPY